MNDGKSQAVHGQAGRGDRLTISLQWRAGIVVETRFQRECGVVLEGRDFHKTKLEVVDGMTNDEIRMTNE